MPAYLSADTDYWPIIVASLVIITVLCRHRSIRQHRSRSMVFSIIRTVRVYPHLAKVWSHLGQVWQQV